MNYRELMSVLSQCELGAALLSEDGAILELNETGLRLLHGDGSLAGKYLRDIAPNLCSSQDPPLYEISPSASTCCAVPRRMSASFPRTPVFWSLGTPSTTPATTC